MESSAVRLADVAAAAGVSRSTVSNALSRPELVRRPTRELIRQAINELGYVTKPHAAARGKVGSARGTTRRLDPARIKDPIDGNLTNRDDQQPAEPARKPGAGWDKLNEGDAVELSCNGISKGTAAVDTIGVDRTVLWVWLDSGMGRKMIDASDGIEVKLRASGKASHPQQDH